MSSVFRRQTKVACLKEGEPGRIQVPGVAEDVLVASADRQPRGDERDADELKAEPVGWDELEKQAEGSVLDPSELLLLSVGQVVKVRVPADDGLPQSGQQEAPARR